MNLRPLPTAEELFDDIPDTYDQWWDEEIATLQHTYPDMDMSNPIEVRYFLDMHHPDTIRS
jgi:hypothetical protein